MGPAPRRLMRSTTREERRLAVVVASAMAGVFGMMTVVLNRERPIHVGVALAMIVLAAVIAVRVEWRRRIDPPDGPRFWDLPSTRRGALRRELLTGRTGSTVDRPYAGFWLGRRLRYPANSATLIGLAGWYAGLPPSGPWSWVLAGEWGLLVLVGAVPLLLRPRWLRLADRLDAQFDAAFPGGSDTGRERRA